jgi:outer membrane protein assembly factor BamB
MLSLKNRKLATMATLIMVLSIAATLFALPTTNAHDPPSNVPTWAYISASPNPVGVGQTVLIVFWINEVPATSQGLGGDRWRNLTVDITKPDGTKETLGPFTSDPIGGGYAMYTPDSIGTYTLTFKFPGQVLSLYGPTGEIGTPSDLVNDTFLASSATTNLVVQQEQISPPSTYPLPSEYWTRPIEGQNSVWSTLASNWLVGAGPIETYNVQPDGAAPNSPHIMWTKPLQDGGVVGGSYPVEDITYYAGESYEIRFDNPMVIHGRLYYNLPLGSSHVGGNYVCVDLTTGETIWSADWTTALPTFGQLFDYESQNQHGVLPNGILWRVDGTTWMAYDSLTGTWMYNLTNVPSGSNIMYGPHGEIVRYVIDNNHHWLALWNNTQHSVGLEGATDETSTASYQWRPNGKSVNMATAYSWNVTIPSLNGYGNPTVRKVIPDDLLLGSFGSTSVTRYHSETELAFTVFAISLKPESRGQLLWIKNYTTTGNVTRQWGLVDVENRIFTIVDQQTMKWSGYSMDNGNLLWGPVGDETAFNYYSYGGMGSYNAGAQSIANGILYSAGEGGLIYALDIKTGKLLWTFGNGGPGNSTHTPLGEPYPYWPIFIGNIADGKIYTFTYEHSNDKPSRKDAMIYCINATTGEQLWQLIGWPSSTSHANRAGVIADGYLAYFNTYDSQVYCIGKGPSATTVSAPNVAVPEGTVVLLQGTVTDIAAGTQQDEQAGRFPNGVPAVSDDCMSAWMEYVYMQKPKPADVTGVVVHLTAIDPNGNFQDIGTATSNALGTYAFPWVPPVPGLYTVTATFEGSESYYRSEAATSLYVSEAAAPAVNTPAPTQTAQPTVPTPTPMQSVSPSPSEAPQPPASAMPTTTYIAIGVAVIVIVAAAAVLILRKRK